MPKKIAILACLLWPSLASSSPSDPGATAQAFSRIIMAGTAGDIKHNGKGISPAVSTCILKDDIPEIKKILDDYYVKNVGFKDMYTIDQFYSTDLGQKVSELMIQKSEFAHGFRTSVDIHLNNEEMSKTTNFLQSSAWKKFRLVNDTATLVLKEPIQAAIAHRTQECRKNM